MTTNVLSGLWVNEERMRKNLNLTQGRAMTEAVMIALVKKGLDRQEAHELLRKLTLTSETERQSFKKVLSEDKIIREKLNEKEVADALNPRHYLGTIKQQLASVVRKTLRERKARGLD